MRHASRLFISSSSLTIVALAATLMGAPALATAAPPPGADRAPTATDLARVEADLARVQQELREQKVLVLQVMEMQNALLRYLQSGGAPAGASAPAFPSPPAAAAGGAAPMMLPPPGGTAAAEPAPDRAPPRATGAITGVVHAKSGALGETFVYVDGPKVIASHTPMLEIKQRNKQFTPSVAVVQTGTRVLFPNEDKLFHNVFSPTPGDAFDLGTLKAGDRPNPVTLMKPGHVEIFCNIHSRMRADVLVVPNAHWTRVRADGSFQIQGVPYGPRHLVLWGPGIKPVSQKLEVNGQSASVTFAAEPQPPARHLNKSGSEYGSYDD